MYYTSMLTAAFTLALFCSSAVARRPHINLQWAICDKDYETVLHKLGLTGQKPFKAGNTTYYDTSPPMYAPMGLAFRTKEHSHQPISMIKVRFDHVPKDLPKDLECTWDRYGDRITYTCSVSAPLNGTQSLWTRDEVLFAERFQPVNWAALVPYGPSINPKWKFRPAGYKGKFDDLIYVVDGQTLHIMELEVETKKHHSHKAYRRITRYLEKRGVVLCEKQISKTSRLFHTLEGSISAASNGQQATLMDSNDHEMELK